MKTKYKYIHFSEEDYHPTIGKYRLCCNNKTNQRLGYVSYYNRWRQWVFSADETAVFNDDCLRDIADFLGQLNQEQVTDGNSVRHIKR